MESISRNITPLVINSLGGGHKHTNTHTHTHTHTHTDVCTETISRNQALQMLGSAIQKIDLRELTCKYPSHIKPGVVGKSIRRILCPGDTLS